MKSKKLHPVIWLCLVFFGIVTIFPACTTVKEYQKNKLNDAEMYGTYEMENLFNKSTFEVNIPIFEMIVPFKMN